MQLLNIHTATALYPFLYESNQITWQEMKEEGKIISFHVQIIEKF